MWLPYVIYRELYLMGIADYVASRPHAKNWTLCHPAGMQVIPNFVGC